MKLPIAHLLAFISLASSVCADSPLPPLANHSVKSPNGRFEARITVSPEQTTVSEVATSTRLWWKEGFHRDAFLADDGQHFIVSYWGLNLIPLDSKPDLVMLEFFDGPKVIKRVTLGEIVPDMAKLERTSSHYHWGSSIGFDGEGRFCVETVEKNIMKFDLQGRLLAVEKVVAVPEPEPEGWTLLRNDSLWDGGSVVFTFTAENKEPLQVFVGNRTAYPHAKDGLMTARGAKIKNFDPIEPGSATEKYVTQVVWEASTALPKDSNKFRDMQRLLKLLLESNGPEPAWQSTNDEEKRKEFEQEIRAIIEKKMEAIRARNPLGD